MKVVHHGPRRRRVCQCIADRASEGEQGAAAPQVNADRIVVPLHECANSGGAAGEGTETRSFKPFCQCRDGCGPGFARHAQGPPCGTRASISARPWPLAGSQMAAESGTDPLDRRQTGLVPRAALRGLRPRQRLVALRRVIAHAGEKFAERLAVEGGGATLDKRRIVIRSGIGIDAKCARGFTECRFSRVPARRLHAIPADTETGLPDALRVEPVEHALKEHCQCIFDVGALKPFCRFGRKADRWVPVVARATFDFEGASIEPHAHVRKRLSATMFDETKPRIAAAEQAPPIHRDAFRQRIDRDQDVVRQGAVFGFVMDARFRISDVDAEISHRRQIDVGGIFVPCHASQSKISRRSASLIGQPLYSPLARFKHRPCHVRPCSSVNQRCLGNCPSPLHELVLAVPNGPSHPCRRGPSVGVGRQRANSRFLPSRPGLGMAAPPCIALVLGAPGVVRPRRERIALALR